MASCRTNSTMTPNTTHNSTPDNLDPILRLTTTTGPVKSLADDMSYLEHRLLIALENNFNLNTLANLLVSMSLDPKILDQATNIIRAVALLMVSKIHNTFADKLHTPTNLILKQLNHKNSRLPRELLKPTLCNNFRVSLQHPTPCSNTWKPLLQVSTTH